MLELTILMPCLDEAETLATCIRKARSFLDQNAVDGEVMIADNGSTDGSQEIARREGAVVVDVAKRGYGAALLGGIRASRARYIIMGDADDSYDFTNLMPFVAKLRQGADLVMGNRFKGGIADGAMPFLHRWLGNPVLSFLGRLFFRIPVGDFHCGLRGFNRQRITELGLLTPGMEFASEMVVKSALSDYDIAEVPTTLSPDGRSRAPHLRTWRDGWRHLRFLLLFSPRYLYLVPGLALLIAGLLGVAMLYAGPRQISEGVVLDIHSYIAFVMMVIAGVQVLLFGAIARALASSLGIRQQERPTLRPVRSLENMLLLALALFLCGAAGAIWCFGRWAAADFQALDYGQFLHPFLLSLAALVVAAQMAFTSFFAATIFEFFRHGNTADPSR
ncbi:MAG: glycosyltransferase family 2 protein [Ottowia sp.]|nr:glycosyltransferase family 2 protein [Ottowia sp.]